jgi:hypothetical protein
MAPSGGQSEQTRKCWKLSQEEFYAEYVALLRTETDGGEGSTGDSTMS